MGLQFRGHQYVMHRRGRQLEIARQGPDRPSAVGLRLLAGTSLDAFPYVGPVLQRAASTGRIPQAVDARRGERATPFAGCDLRNPERRGDLLIRLAGARSQHNPAPQRQALRRRWRPDQVTQHRIGDRVQRNNRRDTWHVPTVPRNANNTKN